MRKIFVLLLLIALASTEVMAQRRNGLIKRRVNSGNFLTVSFGPSYSYSDPYSSKGFWGPVSNQNFFKNQEFSAGFRQIFAGNIGYHAYFSYNHFTGSDLENTRQMSFSANAFQLSGVGEYTYDFSTKFDRFKPNTVYGFLGLGFIYNHADLINGGSGHSTYKYKERDFKPTIPYGFGYRYNFFGSGISVGAEVILRYTFSDYLDGFKPPYPESKSNDIFQGFKFTGSYKLKLN